MSLMLDAVQIVLLFVIVLLTILLVVLGVQVFFILKELRKTIFRATRILENTEVITESVSEPMSFISTFLFSTKTISILSKLLKGKKKEEKE